MKEKKVKIRYQAAAVGLLKLQGGRGFTRVNGACGKVARQRRKGVLFSLASVNRGGGAGGGRQRATEPLIKIGCVLVKNVLAAEISCRRHQLLMLFIGLEWICLVATNKPLAQYAEGILSKIIKTFNNAVYFGDSDCMYFHQNPS